MSRHSKSNLSVLHEPDTSLRCTCRDCNEEARLKISVTSYFRIYELRLCPEHAKDLRLAIDDGLFELRAYAGSEK